MYHSCIIIDAGDNQMRINKNSRTDTILYKGYKVVTTTNQRNSYTEVYFLTGRRFFETQTTSEALSILEALIITYSQLSESITKEDK